MTSSHASPHPPPPDGPGCRSDDAPFVARGGTDLVALVPLVLGFHPSDSVVLLTFPPSGRSFHARLDLPTTREEHHAVAEVLLAPVLQHRVGRVAVLVYSDDVEVARSQGEVLLEALLAEGVGVIDVLRVGEDAWHPLGDPGDPEGPGTAYDLGSHPFTARHVLAGHRLHRDRDEVADTLVGTDEDDTTAVGLAATRFLDQLVRVARRPAAPDGTPALDLFLCTEARWLQSRVRRWVAEREPLGTGEAGRVLVLASFVPTRDAAWAEIDRRDACAHVDLWRAVVRRAPRELRPGAAALLAFAAWQHGDGALAWCAVDRALDVDPDHRLAHCVADLLRGAVPPSSWEPVPESALPVFAPERRR